MLKFLTQRLERLQDRPFLRSVMVLVGGTAFAQGLMILILPVLTRLYTPEDFDILAVYVALLGLFIAVASIRYNIAIPIPEADKDGASLLVGALTSNALAGAGLALLVGLASNALLDILAQPRLKPYLWLVPIGVFFGASYNALQYWASRKKRFGIITETRMTRALGGAGTQVSFGALTSGPFGLIVGHATYSGLGVVRLAIMLLRQDRSIFGSLTIRHVWDVLKRYRRFPFFSVPEALFNIGGTQFPILIIAATSIRSEAGYLMLAMQVLVVPVTLIGASVTQVYLSEASQKLKNGRLANFTRKTMWLLFKTGTPPLLVTGIAAPFVFAPIFGEEWARAGVIVSLLMPSFILQFVASPVSMILHVTDRQMVALLLQAAGLVVRVGAVLWAGTYAPIYIIEIYAAAAFLYYAGYLGVLLFLTANETKQ